jgi:hypothetical protein
MRILIKYKGDIYCDLQDNNKLQRSDKRLFRK